MRYDSLIHIRAKLSTMLSLELRADLESAGYKNSRRLVVLNLSCKLVEFLMIRLFKIHYSRYTHDLKHANLCYLTFTVFEYYVYDTFMAKVAERI